MPRTRITERDRDLLNFLAHHRIALAAHVQAWLGISAAAAGARLRALEGAGLIVRDSVFHRQPACWRITRRGLHLIGSRLPAPRVDLRGYRHDVGTAWLWLAAHRGTFGPLREVISERALRSRDSAVGVGGEAIPSERLAVRLPGLGPAGRERLHYPDLVLVDPAGRRIAVELELTGKSRQRRERILSGYGADARFDAVLYLVEHDATARSIQSCARRMGISHRVHVQPVRGPADVVGGASPTRRLVRERPLARGAER